MDYNSREAEALKAYINNFSVSVPAEDTVKQVKHALDRYRREFSQLQKSAEVPRVVRDALPSIRGQILGQPYGEPAPEKPYVKIAAWGSHKGPPSKKRRHTPKAGVPPGAQWRVATSLVKAINKGKLYSTEDGEPTQVDESEEALAESQLRHALRFDEYAIAKVVSLCEFSPEAIAAIGHIEDWTWDVTKRFMLSSDLVASYWRDFRHQQSSQSQHKATYGLRRLLKGGSHLGGILNDLRNIARNPSGDDCVYKDIPCEKLEMIGRPSQDAATELTDFYYALALEQIDAQSVDADLFPDTEAGMAVLQLNRGDLGRTFNVVRTLLRTSLSSSSEEEPILHDPRAKEDAILNPLAAAAAAAAGFLPAGESSEETAFNAANVEGAGQRAETAGEGPVQPLGLDESEFVFEWTLLRDPNLPRVQSTVGSTKACVRCGVFMCERHRNVNDEPMADNAPAVVTTYLLDGVSGSASLREDVKWHKKQWEEPCSKECFRLVGRDASAVKNANPEWTANEKAKLAEWAPVYRRNPCLLAELFFGTHTCYDVHTQLRAEPLPNYTGASSDEDGDAQNVALQGSVRRKKKAKSKQVTNGQQPAAQRRNRRDANVPWSEYVPCSCDPEKGCNSTCPCAKSHNFCEKHCRCGGNCKNAHQGCKCKGSCTTGSQCPCLLQQRECDPAKCLGCCPTAHGTVRPGGVVCQNMNLLLGVTRRLAVGLSEVAGWGCFVMEDIKEGEYIGEYTGELLQNEEVERRGAVYDRRDTSYLFTLNDKWAIDAQKVGNKLRFANHKKNANAAARVMMLGGDHHVGIYAKTNLPAGTEIFYDYGYASGQREHWCPDWAEHNE